MVRFTSFSRLMAACLVRCRCRRDSGEPCACAGAVVVDEGTRPVEEKMGRGEAAPSEVTTEVREAERRREVDGCWCG